MRKLWNRRNFKAHVSPHEMLQAVVHVSRKRFQITKQGDAIEFLAWLLNSLHRALGGTKKIPSVITNTFQGHLKVVREIIKYSLVGRICPSYQGRIVLELCIINRN